MYKICKTPKAEARQREFQDTLIRLLDKQKMESITIVSLCKEMQISRKTFYQYFDTLEDVLYAVVDREMRAGFLLLEIEPEVQKFFLFWKERKWLLDILENNGMSQLLVNRMYVIVFSESDAVLVETKGLKYAGMVSAIVAVLILWHHNGMKQSVQEMEQVIFEMFHH